MQPTIKKETFTEWLLNAVILYIVPFCITATIVITECWPYKPLQRFFTGSDAYRFNNTADDVLKTGIFLVTVGIFWSIKYLITKKNRA
jgi:hypothetical protein